jgi:ER lumen protein retaining receptor
VFLTRYLDLFTNFYSFYNEFMKLFYILASGAIVYAMRVRHPWKATYEMDTMANDTFQHVKFAIAPCALIALFINEGKLADVSRRAASCCRPPSATLTAP